MLRTNLKRSNFSDQEIDMFFDMFKEDPAMEGLIVGKLNRKKKPPLTQFDYLIRVDIVVLQFAS